jgi:hypothetical protein
MRLIPPAIDDDCGAAPSAGSSAGRALLWLLALFVLAACGAESPPQRSDPVVAIVAAEVGGEVDAITARLREFFNDGTAWGQSNRFAIDDRLYVFKAVPVRSPAGLQQVQAPADAALARHADADPALQRYLERSRAQRGHDLYLYQPTGPHWWPSEYRQDGRVLEFSTHFIVHLQPLDAARTRIEVIEVMPRVRLGKKWAWSRHGVGFGRVDDVRMVAPTTRDRGQLLGRIVDAVGDGDAR